MLFDGTGLNLALSSKRIFCCLVLRGVAAPRLAALSTSSLQPVLAARQPARRFKVVPGRAGTWKGCVVSILAVIYSEGYISISAEKYSPSSCTTSAKPETPQRHKHHESMRQIHSIPLNQSYSYITNKTGRLSTHLILSTAHAPLRHIPLLHMDLCLPQRSLSASQRKIRRKKQPLRAPNQQTKGRWYSKRLPIRTRPPRSGACRRGAISKHRILP